MYEVDLPAQNFKCILLAQKFNVTCRPQISARTISLGFQILIPDEFRYK